VKKMLRLFWRCPVPPPTPRASARHGNHRRASEAKHARRRSAMLPAWQKAVVAHAAANDCRKVVTYAAASVDADGRCCRLAARHKDARH